MALPAPFTLAQLQFALGGAVQFLQLFDKNKTGNPNDATALAIFVEVQNASAGEVYSILQVAFNPLDPTFQAAAFVQENALAIGVYWSWHKSTGGIAVPEEVKTARAEAVATLEKAREGLRSLGTDVDPGSDVDTVNVTIDSSGKRILRKNMNGFC